MRFGCSVGCVLCLCLCCAGVSWVCIIHAEIAPFANKSHCTTSDHAVVRDAGDGDGDGAGGGVAKQTVPAGNSFSCSAICLRKVISLLRSALAMAPLTAAAMATTTTTTLPAPVSIRGH